MNNKILEAGISAVELLDSNLISDDTKDKIINSITFVDDYWLTAQGDLDKKMNCSDIYSSLVTEFGKHINYGNCIADEVNELMHSTPWKHWKDIDGAIDYNNLKVEMVDLMHFIPALLNVMEIHKVDSSDIEPIDIRNRRDIYCLFAEQDFIDQISKSITNNSVVADIAYVENKKEAERLMIDRIIRINNLLAVTAQHYFSAISEKDIEKQVHTQASLEKLCIYSLGAIFDLYSKLFTFDVSIERAVDELWDLYLVKSTLNLFRANNGYKEGAYIKIWEKDKEDNMVAIKLAKVFKENRIDDETVLDAASMYAMLESFYNLYVKKV